MCVHVCGYGLCTRSCSHARLSVYTHVEGRGQLECLPGSLSTIFVRQDLSLNLSFINSVRLVRQWAPGSLLSLSPLTGAIDACHCSQLSSESWRPELKSSCLPYQHFPSWVTSTAPHFKTSSMCGRKVTYFLSFSGIQGFSHGGWGCISG